MEKRSYISHLSQILQHEANDLRSSCVDVFVPYKRHIVGESLYVPGKKISTNTGNKEKLK